MGALVALGPSRRLMTERWEALGTSAVLRYAGPASPAVREAVELELRAIDAAASRFSTASELSRLNAAAGRRVQVTPLLAEAVRLGIRAAAITDGAVDPTLGQSLVSVGYDREFSELTPIDTESPPTAGAAHVSDRRGTSASRQIVIRRRRVPAWRRIELGDSPPSVRLPPGVSLDLGATAKALAADRAARAAELVLSALDLERGAMTGEARGVLVALGGDIATRGPAPDGGWQIHVTDDHRAGPDAPGQTVSIVGGGVATSSIAVRRWRHHGEAMHHILDPITGGPARTCWRTVSVAAATCADANIGSTAAIVLGPRAPEWLADQELPARLVALDGAVRIQGGWPE